MRKPSRSKPNIAFVIAHPDDLSNSMGGTAWLLKERYRLHVFCITRGERGIAGKSLAEAGRIRGKEQQAESKLLGAELTFMNLVNGDAFATRELCARLARRLKKLAPAALFTLWPINTHRDHVVAYTAAAMALQQAELYWKAEVYFSENDPGGQTMQFDPDVYVNIDDIVEHKRELVRCHRSQFADEQAVEKVIQRNVIRGRLARCQFAEGFKTLAPVVNSRWGRRANRILLEL
jgi:LmbE family N-acetylglucosaminyl deacetylase